MSTTSPVISLEAEASRFSFPCSAARATGDKASAEINPAATATFKLLGIVELNMWETSAQNSRRSIGKRDVAQPSCLWRQRAYRPWTPHLRQSRSLSADKRCKLPVGPPSAPTVLLRR